MPALKAWVGVMVLHAFGVIVLSAVYGLSAFLTWSMTHEDPHEYLDQRLGSVHAMPIAPRTMRWEDLQER